MTNTITEPKPEKATRPKKFSSDYTIYKPNARGNGGALSFSLNAEKGAVFVEAATQISQRQFDWDNKIIMKWGLADIGSILAGLQGAEQQTKLFHQTEKANSTCNLLSRENPEGKAPFWIAVSRQSSADKQVRKVQISLSSAEAAILETLLRTAVNRILRW